MKNAISDGVHPKIISKGSSGSYFARAKVSGGRIQTIALVCLWFGLPIFTSLRAKPQGVQAQRRGALWTAQPQGEYSIIVLGHWRVIIPVLQTMKWIHRQFRWIIPFGRACLIPNLRFGFIPPFQTILLNFYSYISEAAASLLDRRLELYIVPPTYLVSLSSPVRRPTH